MSSTTADSPLSPEFRSSLYYFSSMMNLGAAAAYAGIWFADRGLNADQIGYINSAPVFVLLLINVFVGKLADRASDWRQVIIAGAFISGFFALSLFFVQGFWPILAAWSLISIAQGAIGPVADAATTRITARRGTSYGSIRAWGTIGYLLAIFAAGSLATTFGGKVFIPLFVGFCLFRALVSLALPKFRSTEKKATGEGLATHFSHLMKPWLLVPLLAWGMIQSTNVTLMAFQALLWKEQGLSALLISNLIALGAIVETIMLFAFPWLRRHFGPCQLMLIAGVVAMIRWTCFAFSPGMPWLIPLQVLHAVTYAVGFLGCVSFLARWTSEDMAAEAQSFSVVIQQAATVLMLWIFGHLAVTYGAMAFLASASMAATAVILLLVSLTRLPPPAVVARPAG